MFGRVAYGAFAGLVLAAASGVLVFTFAPPIPAGDWAVYVRALVALVTAFLTFIVVWFITVVTMVNDGMKEMGGNDGPGGFRP